jgi:hypothetical protein
MPGLGHGDWDETYQQLQSEGTGEDHSVRLIETPVFSRTPIRKGIDASMSFGSKLNGGAPTIPYPIRSSLAQMISIWRAQMSHYFSTVRRGSPEQLDQMGIGHLFAKTEQMPYMSPYRGQVDKMYPKPTIRVANGLGRVGKGGVMGIQPRFNKALRVIDYAYKPPVYGEGE